MAISIAQYVDLLFKKLQGVAKTANVTVKSASNESIASPAFLRGDIVWMEADQIGNVAQSISGVANALTGSNSIECTADTTVPAIGGVRPTWLTSTQYWISQEFGSTWLPKVFVGPSGEANIEATGTQIFAAGSGGTGEYYFDTQSGVLNFIGETIPAVLTSGNVVYVSGYQYVGKLGVTNIPAGNIGNLTISDTTIGTITSGDDIVLQPTSTGIVTIDTTTGLLVPTGNTSQRPGSASTGTIRYNTTSQALEVYDGTNWDTVGTNVAAIDSQTINGDGSTAVFTLDYDSTADGILVSTNGVLQQPTTAYTVSGDQITFAEAPAATDVVEVRFIAPLTTINRISNSTETAVVSTPESSGNVEVTGNIVISGSFLKVPVYANTTTRDAAITSPAAGMIVLTGNVFQGHTGSAWVDFN